MKLLIARHAQSEGNLAGRVQGSQDPPLTPRGRRQALALGKLLRRERIRAAYASPLLRAFETARIVGREPLVAEPRLRENRMGRLEGMTHEQVEEKYPHLFERFFGKPGYRMPGGESLKDVQRRLRPFIRKLYEEHSDHTVLVVAHNTTNRVLLATLLGLPLNRCRVFKQKNACLNTLFVSEARVEYYTLDNELHHLE
jgi:broad specificity phosphatase PhoE